MVGQTIEKMEIPTNELINKHRIKKIKKDLLETASTNTTSKEEGDMLKDVIKEVEDELKLSPQEIALAAINLSIGENSLLLNDDESWIHQADRYRKGNDRRDSRSRHRREYAMTDKDKERFRVEVGHRDRVKPGI